TGDIMYDTVLRNIDIANEKFSNGRWLDEIIEENGEISNVFEKNYYLATIHRAENTDDPKKLLKIFQAFNQLDKLVILPLHPRTKKLIEDFKIEMKNIIIIKPVGYLLMLYLISNAYMVVTDSGGLQKEAYFLKTPCTTLRDQTEWVETLVNSWNVLSSINIEEIIMKTQRELTCLKHPQPMSFGLGNAALKICEAIVNGGKIDE
ncbi:MAG: UDP-N-acetylglucosamine 2-epimerase, partial [Eubacteriales bacterium]